MSKISNFTEDVLGDVTSCHRPCCILQCDKRATSSAHWCCMSNTSHNLHKQFST